MTDEMTILFNHGVTYTKMRRIQRCDVYRGAVYTEVQRTQRYDLQHYWDIDGRQLQCNNTQRIHREHKQDVLLSACVHGIAYSTTVYGNIPLA